MSSDIFVALAPLITLGVAALAILALLCVKRSHALTMLMCLAGLVTALVLQVVTYHGQVVAIRFNPASPALLYLSGWSAYFVGLILAAAIAVTLLSYDYLRRTFGADGVEEYYILLLLATLGSCVLAASAHFVSFFLGLEILSVSLYVLIAYRPGEAIGIEGGIKYLVLAAVSSAFLLFGMALVYARWGTMDLGQLAAHITTSAPNAGLVTLAGLALILVGIGFKLAIVPMHLWTPDVYQAAPAPVTAFIATISKGAMFALLLRYFTQVGYAYYAGLVVLFMVLAVVTMFVGNILALVQNNVKRLLAYSSIAHVGYLLVAFLASREALSREGMSLCMQAVGFYLLAYFAMTLGAFGVLGVLSSRHGDAQRLEDFRGLFYRRPVLASVLSIMLMSLAGLPLTAGFVGKFLIVWAGVGTGLWVLTILLVLNSAVSLYYYLRVVAVMFSRHEGSETYGEGVSPAENRINFAAGLTLAVLLVAVVVLGTYPSAALDLIQQLLAGPSALAHEASLVGR